MRTTGTPGEAPRPVVSAEELQGIQQLVRRIPAAPSLVKYAVQLARSTRPDEDAPEVTRRFVDWGAGPRASQYLVLGAKARAAARGEPAPTFDDVRDVAPLVLPHRIVLNFEAEAEGVTTEDFVESLLRESETWA